MHTQKIMETLEEVSILIGKFAQQSIEHRLNGVTRTAHERNQIIMMDLQANKIAPYDENQKLRNQLTALRIELPKSLSFL